eukprot:scaffold667580_cov60-Prasinocladus_malaysianus.AAC.1
MCRLSELGAEAVKGKTHLVILVNGVAGDRKDWEELYTRACGCSALDHMWFFPSTANQNARTFEGIDVCGKRLIEELQAL